MSCYDDENDDQLPFIPAGFLEDHRYNPAQQTESADWSSESNASLYQALEQLDTRSQEILSARWLNEDNKQTLQDLADKYGISAERVRQLEKSAMLKLRNVMEEFAA